MVIETGVAWMLSSFVIKICFCLGHEKIAELLIKSQANINAADKLGETVLMYAINTGNIVWKVSNLKY